MTIVSIDFAKYLPTASVYFSYSEVLKTQHFVKSEQVPTGLIDIFLEAFGFF
ncbi:MAG: hypothetical protein ACTSYU_13205 [Promethearchaeota archaeon]